MNDQNQKQEVLQRELVFFDCEMSGSDTRYNHIIEIGAVRIDSETGELLDTFVRLVRFPWGSPYEKEALRITGFDWKQWKKYASPLQTVLREFKDFSANAGLAAWGCENDITFLSAACAKTGVELDLSDIFDLQNMASHWGLRTKLSAAADNLLLTSSKFHRATVDAAVTACIYCRLFGVSIPERLKDCLETDFRALILQPSFK
jgi:DNA polymerase III alpha subunit (gram-positive type)